MRYRFELRQYAAKVLRLYGGPRSRAGFSVLEAIVVLAITSLALVLVFSIGSRATQTGFRLGRRALGIADAQLQAESLRTAIAGLTVPPPFSGQIAFRDFDGRPDRLSAGASLGRPTLCSGIGPVGLLSLEITSMSGDTALSCQAGDGPKTTLIDFGGARVRFSYSLDGQTWSDSLLIPGKSGAGGAPDPTLKRAQDRRVWVRVASADNAFQVVEMLSSGLPPPPAPGADVF